MTIRLEKSIIQNNSEVSITGSKSETNRLLLLKALFPEIEIHNLSNSDDAVLMQKALTSNSDVIDIHHAGTAMRFLTAYFATQKGREVILTGSKRMKERPIGILVDALRSLGADIEYVENEGFPPLKIKGKSIVKNSVILKANVSSQYISALLLIATKLKNGLVLKLEGEITSVPYIKMTLSLLNSLGIETDFSGNTITVKSSSKNPIETVFTVESDWSSASYWYSIIALSEKKKKITLSSFKENSLQGDATLAKIYQNFGVETTYQDNSITLQKVRSVTSTNSIDLNLVNAPDIAQTIAVTAFGLGLECHLKGLHTLKIKETDRLVALQNELSKFGAKLKVTNEALHLDKHSIFKTTESSSTLERLGETSVATYNDHRMAMAFAPLSLKRSFYIENADVVSKSYPDFWTDLEKVGIQFQKNIGT